MKRGYKIRIYPTDEQVDAMNVQFGAARWIYNFCLEWKSTAWKERKEIISKHRLITRIAELKKQGETEWLKSADSQVLQQSVVNLDRAYRNFFEGRGKYPRFKNRRSKQSITYPQRVKVNRADGTIRLPKVGDVRAVFHRPFQDGDVIKQVIVSRSETGKYFASISIDNPQAEAPAPAEELKQSEIRALDAGLAHFATLDDARKIFNPRFLLRASKNLARKQKKLSRAKPGTANRAKARRAVAKAHERVANARRDFQQKLSRWIVDESQAVIVETLKVLNMVKNKNLARHIADVAWSSFFSMLEYKLKWAGKRLVRVDQWFPSSKSCSAEGCGFVMSDMPLSIRQWDCPCCGARHDRDVNAALNLKAKGIKILKAEGLFVSAC